jgi:hypothetical protein
MFRHCRFFPSPGHTRLDSLRNKSSDCLPEQPYGAFDALLKEELGFNEKQINEMIANAELAANGGDRRSGKFQLDIIQLKNQGGTSETYTLRRLRRDYNQCIG